MDTDQEILERIARLADDLPALPVVAQQVLGLLSDPTTEPEELQAVLSRDPSLSLKVLRIANSAYYRRSREITTLSAAIVLLGFKTIQSLVLSSAVHRVLSNAGASAEPLWIHCFGAAVACRELSRKTSSAIDPEEAFLTGLFHDVGKGVIAAKFPGVYSRPLGTEGEMEELGFHHGHLGKVLLERWEIPQALAEAVGVHHDPASSGLLGSVVFLGDWLAWDAAPGLGSNPPVAPEQVLDELGLGPAEIDKARETLVACLAEEGGEP